MKMPLAPDKIRNLAFGLAHGFRGARVALDDQVFRLDERLRRWDASSERPMFQELRRCLRPGDTMIDVGANFGMHSLFAAAITGDAGRVYAFEPVPANLRLLKRHIGLNSMGGRIAVEAMALSNASAEYVDFFLPREEVAVTASLQALDNTRAIRVTNGRLDDWVRRRGVSARAIKIDVEGAELEVLLGAEQLLARDRPFLLIEIHGFALPAFGGTPERLTAFLAGMGYREKRLEHPALRPDYYQSLFYI